MIERSLCLVEILTISFIKTWCDVQYTCDFQLEKFQKNLFHLQNQSQTSFPSLTRVAICHFNKESNLKQNIILATKKVLSENGFFVSKHQRLFTIFFSANLHSKWTALFTIYRKKRCYLNMEKHITFFSAL